MEQETVLRRLRVWYRFARRRSRGMRRVCISILSLALILDRVVERAREIVGHVPLSGC